MNKQCKSCGSVLPDNANFCNECGGNDFIYFNAPNQLPHSPNQQYSYNQNQQSSIPQKQPKKKKTGLIVGIVIALFLLVGIGAIAEKTFQKQGYGNTGYNNSEASSFRSEKTPDNIQYSKGTFDGSVYINEWADIQLALPEGFSNADAEMYSSVEDSSTDCGVFFLADDTNSLIFVCFEELPTFPVYFEKEYLDSVLKTSGSTSDQLPESYSTVNIGGYSYTKAELEFNNGNSDFSMAIYARKLNNYMICITAVSINSESIDALVSNISKAN